MISSKNATFTSFTTTKCSQKAKHTEYTHERERRDNLDVPQLTVRKTLSKSIKLEPCVQESIWLWASRHGVNANEMATRDGVSTRRVQFGLAAARCRESRMLKDVRRPPRLVPLFPLGPYSPQSVCRHHRPIERGSVFCCMVCHTSGQDDHPALQLDPRFDPKLDDTSTASPKTLGDERIRHETRRQRRRRLFGTGRSLATAMRL
jgi:hypothetical protein